MEIVHPLDVYIDKIFLFSYQLILILNKMTINKLIYYKNTISFNFFIIFFCISE